MADFAKKLTVSFGAFSCTLSGFDDPFPVMSQVVDYFQKLSKSDPSFGAHPERPDTEALRVLAEKTSGLAVGAEMKGDEVVLSSVPDEIEPEFAEPKTQSAPVSAPTEPQAPAPAPIATQADPLPLAEAPTEKTVEATENIDQIVAQAFDDCETFDTSEVAEPEVSQLLDESTPEAQKIIPTEISETIENIAPADAYDQLQIDDLDDEVFENLNAEDIFETAEPTQSIDTNESAVEDVSTYITEAVIFDDVENLDDEDLLIASTEDATEADQDEETDQIPVWAAELISDEPLEEITESPVATIEDDLSQTEEEDLSYDDHVEAEQTALARILAASQAMPDVAQEDVPEKDSEPLELGEDAAGTAKSLVLGFGAAASLDATYEVETSTLDNRTPPPVSEALAAMGISEETEEDFGWAAEESAPAEKPKEATPSAAPLLLTPMQQVAPTQNEIAAVEVKAPSSAINMDQDDPRADLRRFADAAGAVSLTDLLEASAAYSTLVNGRPSFSRGEVLDMLDEFSDEEGFSQEARIKTFGSLLRGGRINRVNNGEYEMSGDALLEYQEARKAS